MHTLPNNTALMAGSSEALKTKWALAIGIYVVFYLCTAPLSSWVTELNTVSNVVLSVVFVALTASLYLGLAFFVLSLVRNEETRFGQLFDGFNTFVLNLLTRLLMLVIIVPAFMLLFVPGIIAALAFSMTWFLIADKKATGPWQALKMSMELVKGHKWQLFRLGMRILVIPFFALIGVLLLVIGAGLVIGVVSGQIDGAWEGLLDIENHEEYEVSLPWYFLASFVGLLVLIRQGIVFDVCLGQFYEALSKSREEN